MASKYSVRSISLPSRSHPSTVAIEEELTKLKTWETSTTSSESISNGLSGLVDLHNCLEDLLNMASTQEVLSQHRNEKCLSVEELLDGSVRLLDIGSIAREVMLQFQEQIRGLESALRRRKGDSTFIQTNMANYISLRKKARKEAKILMSGLKAQMDNKLGASSSLLHDQDHHFSAIIRAMREVNALNSNIFQSLLTFLSTPVSNQKQRKWSLVSKLFHKGTIASEEKQETIINDLEIADGVVVSEGKSGYQKLEAVEKRIEEVENVLGCLFRRLIKTRSSLLNIISSSH